MAQSLYTGLHFATIFLNACQKIITQTLVDNKCQNNTASKQRTSVYHLTHIALCAGGVLTWQIL